MPRAVVVAGASVALELDCLGLAGAKSSSVMLSESVFRGIAVIGKLFF
jgi:hypothetical protein